jgi:(p)ppGpp synthase/HD superfamily hydrolase
MASCLHIKITNQLILSNQHTPIMTAEEKLKNLILAPYIIKATALIGKERGVGGNQFRHAMATMAILLDYKLFDDYVLLKASVIHDLLEDVPETNEFEIRIIDGQADQVLELVKEVTRPKDVEKADYLKRILEHGSRRAKILKCADRISNLTDLHRGIKSDEQISVYLDHTEKFVISMAQLVNDDMVKELTDLVARRRKLLKIMEECNPESDKNSNLI